MSLNHIKWMNFAILQGLRSKGATGKNPPVGCVIVKNDILLSCGRTGVSGRPHAEEEAINKVVDKKNLNESSMYVTLEPCAHKNKNGVSPLDIGNVPIFQIALSTNDKKFYKEGL